MRELTEKEKELLVGGAVTMDAVQVYAPSFYDDWGFDYYFVNDDWYWDQYSDYYESGGGGGVSYECESFDGTTAETYTDAKASELARAITAKTDHTSNEYLGFIYRDEHGVLRSSQLFGNGTGSVTVNFEQLGFPVSQIVGIVHNHDKYHYGGSSTSELVNAHPSANDWDTATNLVAHGADPNLLALYLLDTNDAFREYSYSDKSRYIGSNGVVSPSAPLGATTSKTLQPSSCPL